MWKFMLKKVAMSQGFRLCFSEDLGGMPYAPEEMAMGSSETLESNAVIEAEIVNDAPPEEDQACVDARSRIDGMQEFSMNSKSTWKEVSKLAKKCEGLTFVKDRARDDLTRAANIAAAKPIEPSGDAQRECPESGDMIYESLLQL